MMYESYLLQIEVLLLTQLMSVYFTGPFPDSAHQQNVPCARCYAPRSAKMMIPGRISCPSRWTKEYSGMLGVSVNTLH